MPKHFHDITQFYSIMFNSTTNRGKRFIYLYLTYIKFYIKSEKFLKNSYVHKVYLYEQSKKEEKGN